MDETHVAERIAALTGLATATAPPVVFTPPPAPVDYKFEPPIDYKFEPSAPPPVDYKFEPSAPPPVDYKFEPGAPPPVVVKKGCAAPGTPRHRVDVAALISRGHGLWVAEGTYCPALDLSSFGHPNVQSSQGRNVRCVNAVLDVPTGNFVKIRIVQLPDGPDDSSGFSNGLQAFIVDGKDVLAQVARAVQVNDLDVGTTLLVGPVGTDECRVTVSFDV